MGEIERRSKLQFNGEYRSDTSLSYADQTENFRLNTHIDTSDSLSVAEKEFVRSTNFRCLGQT